MEIDPSVFEHVNSARMLQNDVESMNVVIMGNNTAKPIFGIPKGDETESSNVSVGETKPNVFTIGKTTLKKSLLRNPSREYQKKVCFLHFDFFLFLVDNIFYCLQMVTFHESVKVDSDSKFSMKLRKGFALFCLALILIYLIFNNIKRGSFFIS